MVFAAGLGTRLKPITDTCPKALVNVGGDALLGHVIRKLVSVGFDDIVINAHHFHEQISEYVASHDFGVRISVSVEYDQPLETGGGIRHAESLLKGSGHFLVHNVDIISNLDIPQMMDSSRCDAVSTLLVSDRKTNRYLLFDEQMRLKGWTNVATGEVKTPFENLNVDECRKLAFGGVHYMSDEIFPLLSSWPDKFSIIDFYLNSAKTHPIYGYVQDDLKLIDVGKIETIAEAESYLSR